MPSLQAVWFGVLGFMLVGYAVLDGFDLGIGALHLFVGRSEEERGASIEAIGPIWDGNEVWLVAAGGSLLAAFPAVYGAVLSGFYLVVMLLLAGLILRGVSIEMRGREENRFWRLAWDCGFSIGSALTAFLFGVALGNVVRGLPFDASGVYRGGLSGLLDPFALAMGLLTLALAAQQGAAWLAIKTEGRLAERARRAGGVATFAAILVWILVSDMAWFGENRIYANFGTSPLAWIGPVIAAFSFVALFFAYRMRLDFAAFALSSLAIVGLAVTAAGTLYPNLVPGLNGGPSLTIDNASSSNTTLGITLLVAGTGMPVVMAYTAFIYWKFKGKVGQGQGRPSY